MFRHLLSRKPFYVGLILFCLIAIGSIAYLGRIEQTVGPETENVEETPVAAPEQEDSPPQLSVATPSKQRTPVRQVSVATFTQINRPPTMKELLEQRRSRRKPEPPELEGKALEWYLEWGETLSEEDFRKKVFDELVGDMPPYEAIDYLETYGIFQSLILDRVDIYRAFEYIRGFHPGGTDVTEYSKIYAARILEADPEHLEAQLYLASREPDDAKREVMYRRVLEDHPNSTDALVDLGRIVWKDRPVEAVELGKKAAGLGDQWGYIVLGYAYQRLGDYDTALAHMKRGHAMSPNPFSAGHIQLIEDGTPGIEPLALETPLDEADLSNEPAQEKRVSITEKTTDPPAPSGIETLPENRQHQDRAERDAAAAAARAEWTRQQQQARQALNQLRDLWDTDTQAEDMFERIITEKQITPQRLTRALETLNRHGPEKGLQRLKQQDPEVAKHIENMIRRR